MLKTEPLRERPGLGLSPDLSLPLDLVTQKIAILGRSGSGKTYTAMKLTELLLQHELQVVVVDSVGVWWGLRLGEDGHSAGLQVPVLGGQHGDLGLHAGAGAVIAELVAQRRLPLVLDVSEFTGAEQRRFVADFATGLLARKKHDKGPVLIVWDEAQDFCPQQARGDAAMSMVEAMERLIKQGRNFGVGTLLCSQRPQSVNKDVLNQTELLLLAQLAGPQEVKAVEAWVREHSAEGRDQLDQLHKLAVGEILAWSPSWLRIFQRVKVARRVTFDASRTPAVAETAPPPLAPIDLAGLDAAIRYTLDQTAHKDPVALRAQYEALQRENQHLRAELRRVRDLDLRGLVEDLDRLYSLVGGLTRRVSVIVSVLRAPVKPPDLPAAEAAARSEQKPAAAAQPARSAQNLGAGVIQPRPDEQPQAGEDRPPAKAPRKVQGAQRILAALASVGPAGLSRAQVALCAGFTLGGGGFHTQLSELRQQRLIEDRDKLLYITEAGVRVLGDACPQRAATTEEVLALWRPRLRAGARTMLDVLLQAYPQGLSRFDLAERAGLSEGSGGFNTNLSDLRTSGLVKNIGRLICACPTLFPDPQPREAPC